MPLKLCYQVMLLKESFVHAGPIVALTPFYNIRTKETPTTERKTMRLMDTTSFGQRPIDQMS
jgi:hypothetical protein